MQDKVHYPAFTPLGGGRGIISSKLPRNGPEAPASGQGGAVPAEHREQGGEEKQGSREEERGGTKWQTETPERNRQPIRNRRRISTATAYRSIL